MNIHNYTKYILYIQIHFFSSRARADKVNEVALSPSGLPSSTSLYPPLALISGHHSLLQAHSNIWRLVKYAQCLPFCRLCPCQRRRTALMPFKRNTTRITSLPHTHTRTHTHTHTGVLYRNVELQNILWPALRHLRSMPTSANGSAHFAPA